MTRAETAGLLALCSAFDSRTIGDTDVLAWYDLLVNTPYDDAKAAVRAHYARESSRIMPADLLAGVRQIRRDRLDAADATFQFIGDPDDTAEYQRQLAEHRQAVGDGQHFEPPAITAGEPPREVRELARRKGVPGRRDPS